jgi:predicted transporter
MKRNIIITILVLLGLYWLVGHADPFPLNHESFGLYEHTIHRIVGVVLLAAAVFLTWKWKFKKQQTAGDSNN